MSVRSEKNLEHWVAVVRWARRHEQVELARKRKDTTNLDLRSRWVAAMKLAASRPSSKKTPRVELSELGPSS